MSDQWESMRQYELQKRQQRLTQMQHLAEEQDRKKKEIEQQHLDRERARVESQRRLSEERGIAEQKISEKRRLSEETRNALLAQSAEEIRRQNAQKADAQRAALQKIQAAQKPRIWISSDGREFRSPREAEFWDAWIQDNDRAEYIPLVPQYRIGRYHVDFAHVASKTVIELDGRGFHIDKFSFTNDRVRQRTLEKQGWHFIRFSGDEISADVDGRVQEVYDFIQGRQGVDWIG